MTLEWWTGGCVGGISVKKLFCWPIVNLHAFPLFGTRNGSIVSRFRVGKLCGKKIIKVYNFRFRNPIVLEFRSWSFFALNRKRKWKIWGKRGVFFNEKRYIFNEMRIKHRTKKTNNYMKKYLTNFKNINNKQCRPDRNLMKFQTLLCTKLDPDCVKLNKN